MPNSPDQIIKNILKHKKDAFDAHKFHTVLHEEIVKGGYSDPDEIQRMKSKISLLMVKIRVRMRKENEERAS